MDPAPKLKCFTESTRTNIGGRGVSCRFQETSAQGQGSISRMQGSAFAWCRSGGAGSTVGRVSGHKTVEEIVQSEQVYPLQALAKDTVVQSSGVVLGDVEKPAVQS